MQPRRTVPNALWRWLPGRTKPGSHVGLKLQRRKIGKPLHAQGQCLKHIEAVGAKIRIFAHNHDLIEKLIHGWPKCGEHREERFKIVVRPCCLKCGKHFFQGFRKRHFRRFLQQFTFPRALKIHASFMALFTDDVGDSLERLCSLRKIILPAHGFQCAETSAEGPYVVGIDGGYSLDEQCFLALSQKIILHAGNEKVIQLCDCFSGGQLPFPIAVQPLRFFEKFLDVGTHAQA